MVWCLGQTGAKTAAVVYVIQHELLVVHHWLLQTWQIHFGAGVHSKTLDVQEFPKSLIVLERIAWPQL